MTSTIPRHVLDKFKSFGAVQYSHSLFKSDAFSYGQGWHHIWQPYTYVMYFWDKDGNEIGMWADTVPNAATIFAPDYRTWDAVFLANQIFMDI